MGSQGAVRQDIRNTKEVIKAAVTPGDSVAKARGRQAIKRVGEYKAAKKAKKKPYDTPLAKAVRDQRRAKIDKKSKEQFASRGKAKQHKADF